MLNSLDKKFLEENKEYLTWVLVDTLRDVSLAIGIYGILITFIILGKGFGL